MRDENNRRGLLMYSQSVECNSQVAWRYQVKRNLNKKNKFMKENE
jgi:hypothetical protein